MSDIITFKFGGLVLPGVPLTELGMTWPPSKVSCQVVPEELKLPLGLMDLSDRIWDIKQPRSNDRVYHYRRAEITAAGLRLEVGRSVYQYTLLHSAFEPKMREEHPEIIRELLKHISRDDTGQDNIGGPLSSGVGVTTVVITSDNQIVLVKRSEKVAVNAGFYHASIAEGVNPSEGVGGTIDLAGVVIRGAHEELGLDIAEREFHFLGLCLDGRYSWPGIIAKAKIRFSRGEVIQLADQARDRWERMGELHFIPNTAEAIAEKLSGAMKPGQEITGFGSVALLQTGVSEFGGDEMIKACQ